MKRFPLIFFFIYAWIIYQFFHRTRINKRGTPAWTAVSVFRAQTRPQTKSPFIKFKFMATQTNKQEDCQKSHRGGNAPTQTSESRRRGPRMVTLRPPWRMFALHTIRNMFHNNVDFNIFFLCLRSCLISARMLTSVLGTKRVLDVLNFVDSSIVLKDFNVFSLNFHLIKCIFWCEYMVKFVCFALKTFENSIK